MEGSERVQSGYEGVVKRKKKIRRSQPIKNCLQTFKVYYINIRDLKCKRESFEEVIAKIKPSVIAVTEIWLDDQYDLKIKDYAVPYINERNKDGGGVLFLVRKELKYVTTEVNRTKEKMESLWIVIDNDRIKLRIGVVYLPQEQDQDVKEIYKIMKQQAREARENKESLMIVGDFNCKVGSEIEGNHGKISKGGKKLLQTIEKEGLVLGNSIDACKGIWTRDEGGKQSVLDYVVIDEEFAEHIGKITIWDDDREISPFNLKRDGKNVRMAYSDHNPIVVETNLVLKQIKTEENKKRRVMTEEGKERYRRELEEKEINKIWDDVQDIQETYMKWCKEVEEIKAKHEEIRKISTKRRSKTMRLLMQEKKKVKERLRAGAKEEDMVRLKELKEQMLDERQQAYFRKLKKNCEEIRKDGKFNSAGFWKVKKRMERRKDEGQHAVRNKKGELVTSNEEILKAYEEHYEDLLTKTNRKTKMEENKDAVTKVNTKFDKIMQAAYEQEPITITEETMERIVNGLKKRKARDNEG